VSAVDATRCNVRNARLFASDDVSQSQRSIKSDAITGLEGVLAVQAASDTLSVASGHYKTK
jgi:hypothetical protein